MITSTTETPWTHLPDPQPCAGDETPDLEITAERTVTFRGFGACFTELSCRALGHLDAADRQALLDDFFRPDGAMGFEFCRMPIGANDYSEDWFSHNETPGDFAMEHFSIARDRRALLPYLREALARNPAIQLFASPWSPPTWLKNPPVFNFGNSATTPRRLVPTRCIL